MNKIHETTTYNVIAENNGTIISTTDNIITFTLGTFNYIIDFTNAPFQLIKESDNTLVKTLPPMPMIFMMILRTTLKSLV